MDKQKQHIYLTSLLNGINRLYHLAKTGGNCTLSNSCLTNFKANTELTEESKKIIKEAEILSAGTNSDIGAIHTRMVPITATVMHSNKTPIQWRMPVCRLDLTRLNFPTQDFEKTPDYTNLLASFEKEFNQIDSTGKKAFAETLLSLLFKYTVNIPANIDENQDVSLYDYVKTTAALAVCLYDANKANEDPENPFIIIGADICGIQPYIYQIVSKYAGKNLKGRSFYIRIISDVIVRCLIKELDLFQANIIYNSGGSFYIVAPNTSIIKSRLKDTIEKIEKQLFSFHGNALYVAMDYVIMSKNTLLHKDGQGIGEIWHSLFEKYDKKKNSKFHSLILNDYEAFFSPKSPETDKCIDIVTGELFQKNEKRFKEGELSPIRKTTKDQILLGKALRNLDCILIADTEIPDYDNILHMEPLSLGMHYYFIESSNLPGKTANIDNANIISLKNGGLDFIGRINGKNNIYSFEFYGGNEAGTDVPTFEEMCEKNDKDTMSRLGVLRMDVDNLGHIFQKGIGNDRLSLSRMAALSRSFDYFFSGYLNTIYRETAPENSFIIYSGGDDLFIVGSWERIIDIAKRIRYDFREFTCHNKAFSISGGISIVNSKFPIMKGAELSAEEERLAKEHKCKGDEKNAISFMSFPLNWDKEFNAVENLKCRLVECLNNGKLPKSFISKILAHWSNAKMRNHKICNPKTYWMTAYDMSRMKSQANDDDAKAIIERFKTEICGSNGTLNGMHIETDYHPLELWAFASRWAELETRTNKN